MNIPATLFLLTCLFAYQDKLHAQEFEQEDIRNYLQKISKHVYSSLASYGLSNLPDVDSKVTYNVSSIAGYHLVGDLFLEDGFVSDLKSISCHQASLTTVWHNAFTVFADMSFKGLTVSRDFRYVPAEPVGANDTNVGTVTIRPHHYIFNILLGKNITNNELITDVRSFTFSPGFEMITFNPDNGLTRRLRKMYRSQFSHGGQTDAFDGLFDLWQPIFQKFLQDAIKKVPFPILQFRARKSYFNL